MLTRQIEGTIDSYLQGQEYKILFVWGPRRSGKTTLLQKYARLQHVPIFNFDYLSDREKFLPDRHALAKIASEHHIVLIDEVQNSPESTVALKLLHDEFRVKIIATGSSELRQTSRDFDTLAGRFIECFCLPLSVDEIMLDRQPKQYEQKQEAGRIAVEAQLFGSYPEVYLTAKDEGKILLLQNLLDTYVLKDVIDIYNLKNVKLARDILTKIALQIGSEVSVREIANSLGANVTTVSSYIEIFIKNYILIPLPSFKTNLRRAVSEHRKIYFYDLGVRNVLVRDFRPLSLRPDAGGVFENFIVIEMEKRRKINSLPLSLYFYREYSGKEVDVVIEDMQKRYITVEIKRTSTKTTSVFPLPHQATIVNGENYLDTLHSILKL